MRFETLGPHACSPLLSSTQLRPILPVVCAAMLPSKPYLPRRKPTELSGTLPQRLRQSQMTVCGHWVAVYDHGRSCTYSWLPSTLYHVNDVSEPYGCVQSLSIWDGQTNR